MDYLTIDGAILAYEVRGTGEPILLLHSGFVAQSCALLMDQPALAAYRVVNYHRRGYGTSTRASGPVTLEQQAADCLALLDQLQVEQAHLAGHSLGANIALQLALSAPHRVRSLALMEPLLTFALTEPSAAFVGGAIGEAFARYGAGDSGGAMDAWLNGAFGSGYREELERAVPGAVAQAERDAATVFESEAPALQHWSVGPAEIGHIHQPVMSVVHEETRWAGFAETHAALLALLPQAESLVVPNASHLLPLMNPRAVAEGLASFVARQAIPATQ